MVEIWNSLPGVSPIERFKDGKTALLRIWKRIQGLGTPEPTKKANKKANPTAPKPHAAPVCYAARRLSARMPACMPSGVWPRSLGESPLALDALHRHLVAEVFPGMYGLITRR
jgi:hypothetical protein